MSLAARLIHRVSIVSRTFDDGSVDEYGQPAPTETTVDDVKALVQPRRSSRRALETNDSRSAGVEISDYIAFLLPRNLAESAYLLFRDERYDVIEVRNFAFGRSPHLEVDLRRVGLVTEVEGS